MSILRRSPLILLAALAASPGYFGSAPDARAAEAFEPYVGQHGKDVVWVPTPQALVDRMLRLARLRPEDYLIDLGSGDGRTVITAARRGTRALGIEYNEDMVELAQRNARKAGVADRAQFRRADLFETDLSQATVITMFLLPEINVKLRPRLLELAPGTRVVSNTFRMGDWRPDASTTAKKNCEEYCTAYLWIVPAAVAGTWAVGDGTLTLKQQYQYVSGTLEDHGTTTEVRGKLEGDKIAFTAGQTKYQGRVAGDTIEGTVASGPNTSPWTATRR